MLRPWRVGAGGGAALHGDIEAGMEAVVERANAGAVGRANLLYKYQRQRRLIRLNL